MDNFVQADTYNAGGGGQATLKSSEAGGVHIPHVKADVDPVQRLLVEILRELRIQNLLLAQMAGGTSIGLSDPERGI